MKRSGFKRPVYERKKQPLYTLQRQCKQAVVTDVARAMPKENPVRSEEYRRLVAAMDCIHCRRAGPSQAAHADYGKGGMIKADDRTCYPLCATTPGRPGCHDLIGASGLFTKEQRRILEVRYAAMTWATLEAAGKIPAGLQPLHVGTDGSSIGQDVALADDEGQAFTDDHEVAR